jgi:hypothetical protein
MKILSDGRTLVPALAAWSILCPVLVLHASAQSSEPMMISGYASAGGAQTFASPEDVIESFKAALAADDLARFAALLGLDPAKLKADDDVMQTYGQIRDGAATKLVVRDINGSKILDIGEKLWPLPFPIVRGSDDKWSFDTYAGFEEILNRRVGENELQAIATLRAYIDAQKEYASEDRDGDGVLEYARKLISSEGKTDGLYWPGELDTGPSPAGGALAEGATLEKAKAGEGYFGYRYRILERQGPNIAGGKYDYVINGNMIAGFALVAWPVNYGETGVHTFEVNANGIVYQADLGKATGKLASAITQFNPGDLWDVTED